MISFPNWLKRFVAGPELAELDRLRAKDERRGPQAAHREYRKMVPMIWGVLDTLEEMALEADLFREPSMDMDYMRRRANREFEAINVVREVLDSARMPGAKVFDLGVGHVEVPLPEWRAFRQALSKTRGPQWR